MAEKNINLLKTQTTLAPELSGIAGQLTRYSYIALGLAVIIGILTATAYLFINNQVSSQTANKASLLRQLSSYATTEAKFSLLKDRLSLIGGSQAKLRDWGSIINNLRAIVPPPKLTAVNVDPNGKIVANSMLPSLTEAIAVANAFVSQAQNQLISQPSLDALSLDKTGNITMTISYIPNFK